MRELVEGELDVAGVGPDLAPELGQPDQQIEIRAIRSPPTRGWRRGVLAVDRKPELGTVGPLTRAGRDLYE